MLPKNSLSFEKVHLQEFTQLFAQNVCNTISDLTGISLTTYMDSYIEHPFEFHDGMVVYLSFYGKVQGEFIIGVSMKDASTLIGIDGSLSEQRFGPVKVNISEVLKEVLNIASAQTLAEVEKKYDNLTYFPPVIVFGDIRFPYVKSAFLQIRSDSISLKCGFSLNLVKPRIIEKLESVQKSLEKSEKIAHTDALTKLYNRTFFESMFNVYIDETRSLNQHLCILLMDIDYFKTVNDTYGHLIGDQVLQYIALVIRKGLRNTDIAVRYGGDEILVVLTSTQLDDALKIANRIRESIKLSAFITPDTERIAIYLSVSIGCTELIESDEPVSLFERADSYLYKAKESGRDRVISDRE